MFSLKHLFNSPKADGSDPTLVKPSDWNAEHKLTASTDGVVIGRAVGAGPGDMQELSIYSSVPPGVILPFAGATIPTGFLLCDGTSYLRTTYPNLYNAILTRYGAVDPTHFSVPNLAGITLVGVGGALGLALAASGGSLYRQPRHYGFVDVSVSGSLGGTITGATATAGAGSGAGPLPGNGDSVQVNGSLGGAGSIRNDGNNLTDQFDVVQPSMAMNFIIKT